MLERHSRIPPQDHTPTKESIPAVSATAMTVKRAAPSLADLDASQIETPRVRARAPASQKYPEDSGKILTLATWHEHCIRPHDARILVLHSPATAIDRVHRGFRASRR